MQTSCRELLKRIHPDDRDRLQPNLPELHLKTLSLRSAIGFCVPMALPSGWRGTQGHTLTTRAGCNAW